MKFVDEVVDCSGYGLCQSGHLRIVEKWQPQESSKGVKRRGS